MGCVVVPPVVSHYRRTTHTTRREPPRNSLSCPSVPFPRRDSIAPQRHRKHGEGAAHEQPVQDSIAPQRHRKFTNQRLLLYTVPGLNRTSEASKDGVVADVPGVALDSIAPQRHRKCVHRGRWPVLRRDSIAPQRHRKSYRIAPKRRERRTQSHLRGIESRTNPKGPKYHS